MMNVQSIPIQLGSLVLLSGPPGCGKSTACQTLPPSLVISSDQLRQTFFGTAQTVVDQQVALKPMDIDDALIFSVMQQVVRSRLQVGLTTIVDATLISDKQREPFGAIADDLHVPVKVIIFDRPDERVHHQNKTRSCPVPAAIVADFIQRLQRDSKWPFTVVTADCELTPVIPTIPDEIGVDAIGDVHGLADELRTLIAKLGYGPHLTHPEGRKLCFLGDLVDRGQHSLEVLDVVMDAIAKGHYCTLGNHDRNLLLGLRGKAIKSRATRETLHFLSQRDAHYQTNVATFLQSLPTFYQYQNYILCHADIDWFDPLQQPGRDRVYGRRKLHSSYDTDNVFRQTSSKQLVRGHIPLTSPNPNPHSASSVTSSASPNFIESYDFMESSKSLESSPVQSPKPLIESLEEGAGFGGPMVAIRLPTHEKVRVPCVFDYSQKPTSFADQMEPLIGLKLVKRVTSPCNQLKLYKYTSKAFFTPEAWQTYPELKLARGVVVGLHNQPVSRPFPRTFNYLEQNTTLPLSTPIVAIEKLNGFLVTTFRHPYVPNTIVVTCSGSFEGDYVKLAKKLLYRNNLYGRVLRYLREHPTLTLLWEAIHRDDPHIIAYDNDQEGLHLIGAGNVAVGHGNEGFLPESQLDILAKTLDVSRPQWSTCLFEEAIAHVQTVNHEGFMIRLEDGTFALKLKSPYYLRTKFLARMTDKKAKFMFHSPEQFKQKLDEAFWPLVDGITQQVRETDWLTWSNLTRRDWVQHWITTTLYSS